jgi:hypothetical protein
VQCPASVRRGEAGHVGGALVFSSCVRRCTCISAWTSGYLLLNQGEDETRPGENVSYIWSGVTDNWGIMLRDRNNFVDLTGTAKIRWRTRYRSFYNLHLLIKLADGTMLAADYEEPEATYWRESEFYLTVFLAGA